MSERVGGALARGFANLNGVGNCLECGQLLTSAGCHIYGTAAGGGSIPRWHWVPAYTPDHPTEDALLADYDPVPGLVARGVMSDEHDPESCDLACCDPAEDAREARLSEGEALDTSRALIGRTAASARST